MAQERRDVVITGDAEAWAQIGKPNPSTKIIWSATPLVTPVTSSARTGSSPHGAKEWRRA
jgi:hypothetical protein